MGGTLNVTVEARNSAFVPSAKQERKENFLRPQSIGRNLSTSKTASRFLDGIRKRVTQNSYDLGKFGRGLAAIPWYVHGALST